MKNGYFVGMFAGAIAGFVDNIVSVVVMILGVIIGVFPPAGGPEIWTLELYITWFTSHLALNIIWGILFGLAFVMVYDSIPRKGIMKGIIYGLIFYFLFSSVREASFSQSYGMFDWALATAWTGFFASIAYGSVLGYLYRK